MSASAGCVLAGDIPGCSGTVGWCCCRQLFVGRDSVEPRAGLLGRVIPWKCEGRAPASVWWHLNMTESSTDKVKNICFQHKLGSLRVQRLPLLYGIPNTKCWASHIGLVQVGFVGKMMWWNGKIMVVCLEKNILCDCLYWSALSRRQPHSRV